MMHPPILNPGPVNVSVQFPRALPAAAMDLAVTYSSNFDALMSCWFASPPDGSGWLLVSWQVYADSEGSPSSAFFWARPKQAKP